MSKHFNIIQFSRDLYVHCLDTYIELLDYDNLMPPKPLRVAIETVDFFRNAFNEDFSSSFEKKLFQVIDTEEQFLKYAIPRCLMLVEYRHYYFSFFLVAAYIGELVSYIAEDRNCYRFSGTGYKCLIAVLRRAFKDKFEKKGGWKGLVSFCERYKNVYNQTVFKYFASYLTFGNRNHKERIRTRIQMSAVLPDELFILDDFEMSLISIDEDLLFKAKQNDKTIGSSETEATADIEPNLTHILDDFEMSLMPIDEAKQNDKTIGSSEIETTADIEPDLTHILEMISTLKLSSDQEPSIVYHSSTNIDVEDLERSSDFETDATSFDDDGEWESVVTSYVPPVLNDEFYELDCKFCKFKCFEYGKTLYKKHLDLCLNVKKKL